MGLINTALQIGRSAITSYQSALSVVGNNIANAADPNYARQRAVLDPLLGAPLPEGVQPGGGVALRSLQRIVNESLEDRLRVAVAAAESLDVQGRILGQIEAAFNELTEQDLSSQLGELFNGFQNIQNDPTDLGLRGVALGNAAALAETLRLRRTELVGLADAINDEVIAITEQANDYAAQIAEINTDLVAAEAGGHTAGALRDRRDALLRQLSELIEITVREQESGSINVFVGNETLVQYGQSRGLTAQPRVGEDFVGYDIRFADDNGRVELRGGQLAGLAEARDQHIGQIIERLDRMAAGLIQGLNLVHSNGQGLAGFTAVTGTFAVTSADLALNDPAAGLDLLPQSGSFFISVTENATGLTTTQRIDIDLDGNGEDTTLNALVAQINDAVPHVSAAVTVDRQLTLSAAAGFSITFGHDGVSNRADSSHVLAALGINTFFEGSSAADIAVNDVLAGGPELLAAAAVPLSGDGLNAGSLTDLRSAPIAALGGQSLFDFYNQTIAELGVEVAAAQTRQSSAAGARTALEAERASISGVNIDEEAVDLLRYERAFQGSARYTTVVDQLISEMLNILR